MGTEVYCKSYLPGYYSMRDLNEDSNSSRWPHFNGEKTLMNGKYCDFFMPRTGTDGYRGYAKDALRQKMLEHEATFKNQVYELHRLYRTQRDMMEEIKRNELLKHRAMMEPSSSSSSLHGSHMQSEEAQKRQMMGFHLLHSGYGKTSVSGVEIVNSPLSCSNGNNKHSGQLPFRQGCSPKDTEAPDSRPSKVRKKLFDLELPANQYVDTEDGEPVQDGQVSGILSYIPNGDKKIPPDSSRKVFLGGDASNACLRRSVGLADLNKPVLVEEARAPLSADFLCCTSNVGESKGVDQSAKPGAGFVRVLGETIYTHNLSSIHPSIDSGVKEKGWLAHLPEAGSSKRNLASAPQSLQKAKLHMPSQPPEVMLSRVTHHPELFPTGHSREDPWRARMHDRSNNNPSEPVSTPGIYPFSGFADSSSHSVSSSVQPTNCFTQKITPLSTSIGSASTSQEIFGDKWKVKASSMLNPRLGSDTTSQNRLYSGPISESEEKNVHLPANGFDYFNCSKGDSVGLKGSSRADRKPVMDFDLNEVGLKSSSNAAMCLQDLNAMDGNCKPEDVPSLHWLKPKTSYNNEAAVTRISEPSGGSGCLQSSKFPPWCKREIVRDLNQTLPTVVMSASSDCEIVTTHKTRNIEKILGVPICEIPNILKNDPSSLVSASDICGAERKITKTERKNRIIDINQACEPEKQIAEETTIEREMHTKSACTRNLIDLNSCITDDEDPAPCSVPSNGAITEKSVGIDLEALVSLENEDDNLPSKENMQPEASDRSSEVKAEQTHDEVMRNAAETIIDISSSSQQFQAEDNILCPPEASVTDPLLWFVDVISSCADKLESKEGDGTPVQDLFDEIDDFEAMTLQLIETKEEDYMPKPFVPEVTNVEEIVPDKLPNRSRRGPARRGRQRRDFQRDILPGLASLSRHEVTEDLQTFGGLMKATGHPWNAGSTRRNGTRNGSARGRRRTVVEVTPTVPTPVCNSLMQQLNNIEGGLEDGSLTGWGKTTRRPRRQRCPGGTPTAVAIT